EMTVLSFLDFIAKIKGIDPRDRKQKLNAAMHSESNIENINPEGLCEARNGIEAENCKVGKIFLAEKQQVPEDGSVLVIAGPTKDLLEKDLNYSYGIKEDNFKPTLINQQ
ncbi:MAG: hypothetical protein JSW07_20745, partial [bacterium]